MNPPAARPAQPSLKLATLAPADALHDRERAALHRELEASIAEADAGETEEFDVVVSRLRAMALVSAEQANRD